MHALNYDKRSIKTGINQLIEFINWIKVQNITSIDDITKWHLEAFFKYLSTRKNKRREGGLSVYALRGYKRELKRFNRYLIETHQGQLDIPQELIKERPTNKIKEIFSRQEIHKIYSVCAADLLGIRDRAMLSIYYGCGLRRNEGSKLELKDVQFNRGMIYVRHGKHYKERYVPMVGRVRNDLIDYLNYSRPILQTDQSGNSLFVGYRGERLGGSQLNARFIKLKKKAGIEKPGGLHGLRHSIATHLLSGGMGLEQIAQFLGHSSLESTQIYTHIMNQNER